MAIKFVYFDLGNVLFSFDHRIACRQLATGSRETAEGIYRELFESGLEARYERGELDSTEFYLLASRSLGLSLSEREFLSSFADIFEPIEEVWRLVDKLSDQVSLGILSNTCQAHWHHLQETHPARFTSFTAQVLSYELGAMKPAATIYQHAVQAAGVLPEEVLFTDDRIENVVGALQVGWQAVQFEHAQGLRQVLSSHGFEC